MNGDIAPQTDLGWDLNWGGDSSSIGKAQTRGASLTFYRVRAIQPRDSRKGNEQDYRPVMVMKKNPRKTYLCE